MYPEMSKLPGMREHLMGVEMVLMGKYPVWGRVVLNNGWLKYSTAVGCDTWNKAKKIFIHFGSCCMFQCSMESTIPLMFHITNQSPFSALVLLSH